MPIRMAQCTVWYDCQGKSLSTVGIKEEEQKFGGR
jgi:hypothetical protein